MPHISLLIIFSTILITQPLYSMELENKERKREYKRSSPLRKKSGGSSSPKQKNHTAYHNNDDDHIPSVSLTTSSTSLSVDIDFSQTQSSKQATYARSKTTDTTPTQHKEHFKLNLFAHSESVDKEKTSRQKGYGRSKTVDTASTRPKESFTLKNLSVSDGATNFSSALKISPRSKLISSAKTIPQSKDCILIDAVKNYDLDTVQNYLKNPEANLNQTDQWGNTTLHHAVIKLTEQINSEDVLKKIITLFLKDLRTDTSIARGMDGRRALDILSGGENPEIRIPLFARATLDITTNQEIGRMLIESYMYDITLDDNLIKKTAECIINKIQATEKKQGGSDLPQEATLPNYATNEFIFTMIKHRIPKEAYNVSEFQKIKLKELFFNERDNIVLLKIPMDFYHPFIEESIEKILEIIDADYTYLNSLITKPCIFEMLKTYTEKYNINVSGLQRSALKDILCKERDSIILLKIPMDIDHPSIQESIKKILAFIQESIEKILIIVGNHHTSFKKIITDKHIFKILKIYVEEQTEANKPSDFLAFYYSQKNNNNNNY